MARFEQLFNVSKLGVLALFIVAGFFLGHASWNRLGPSNFVSATTVIASGMVVFLSYEGFELISNASANILNPSKTLPIAYYGSVLAAIVIYILAAVVAIGHMPFAAMEEARNFALSATAARFLGPFGFGMMTFGAVMASASAINADFFGAAKLPVILAEHEQFPSIFDWQYDGRSVISMAWIAGIALLAVDFVDLHALSAATSGGFLIVFAAVNLANARLARETQSRAWIAMLAALCCAAALIVMLVQFAADPATRRSAYAVGITVLLSVVSVLIFRWRRPKS